MRRVEALKFINKDKDKREQEFEKLFFLQQNCQKLTLPKFWLDCVDDEETPRQKRLGKRFWAQLARVLKTLGLTQFGSQGMTCKVDLERCGILRTFKSF